MGKSFKQKIKNFIKRFNNTRHYIQSLGFFVTNANVGGFFSGKIYKGSIKKPPFRLHFPYYVIGMTALFAIAMGRWFCGYMCPFGFWQDLLHKIPLPKVKIPPKVNSVLRWFKFAFLAIPVFILPYLLPYIFGGKYSYPFFCKYVCPQGILVGSIPHIIYDYFARGADEKQILPLLQALFINKFTIFCMISVCCIFIYRIFCRYICPLGAFLGLFNPISIYRLKINDKCILCNRCQKACKMDIPVFKVPNSMDCIRCDECIKACPVNAIEREYPFSNLIHSTSFFKKMNSKKRPYIRTNNSITKSSEEVSNFFKKMNSKKRPYIRTNNSITKSSEEASEEV